jgi:hypothetical protein
MIASMAPAASSTVRSWRRCSFSSSSLNIGLQIHEVAQHLLALAGQHRLGVELDAMNREPSMADPHDRAILAARRRFEVGGSGSATTSEW